MTATKTLGHGGTAAAPLFHWLLLLSGLSLVTVQRIDHLETVVPLWVGGVIGTALGQLMAQRRVRLWLAVAIVANLMWMAPLATLPIWGFMRDLRDSWGGLEAVELAFAPAAICGYFSLSERATLAVFWFPSVLWVMAILDRSGTAELQGRVSWLLLGGSSVLLLGSLYTREMRRIALWRRHATVRLADARSPAVLREAPLRAVTQLVWMAGLGALSLVITAWIAPRLWQMETASSTTASRATAAATQGAPGTGAPCCAEGTSVEVRRERVREYFPLLAAHDHDVSATPPTQCTVCRDGVPVGDPSWVGGQPGATASGDPTVPGPAYVGGPGGFAPHVEPVVPAPIATDTPVGTAVKPPPPPAPVAVVSPAVAHAPVAFAPYATGPVPVGSKTVLVWQPRYRVERDDGDPLPWLLTLAITALVLRFALRPVRRWLLIRHLTHPFWTETVDQRVSNLWQLVLVGLRDAGWHVAPGEQPQELARRIGLEGMKTCATVLERARHGVRVDREDLEAMDASAREVYEAARARAGFATRAAGWVRWPLV
jgi:hypothetical protein